jgi:RNA polymerase sigma-70 factor (ECF subfamily)
MLDGEERVIKRAIKGEASAFGQLYDHYQPQIYRFIMIKVGHREEAEDLTHQVFLSAWQNVHSYKHRGFPFSSWLYRIARNQVIDFYRTKKPAETIDELDEEHVPVSETLEIVIDRNLVMEDIFGAIAKLKQDYQDVIVLRFVEEYSLKETAEVMEKSEGAVKLIQHRAIRQLKTLLEKPNNYE